MLQRREDDCSGKIQVERRSLGEATELKLEEDKRGGKRHGRTMESHIIETSLLVLGFCFACVAVIVLQVIVSICRMTLTLQEQVAVQATPIVTRVKFSKCRHK